MKILVAPLNWGLGHASRSVVLVRRLLADGHEVVLGGDGESLTLLRQHFPELRVLALPELRLQYSKHNSQVGAMMKAFPKLLFWAIRDHRALAKLQEEEHFDKVISDNRFGLWTAGVACVYMTHQLQICLPDGWHWAERFASRVHAWIYRCFDELWIPDYEDEKRSLAGKMSHPNFRFSNSPAPQRCYIGPLSRFEGQTVCPDTTYDVVAVLSGLEPQRTLLEESIYSRYIADIQSVLIVEGLVTGPGMKISQKNITRISHLGDNELMGYLLGAKRIIVRSGYSSLMDMEALGVMDKVEWVPTPGQPEQEYLAEKWMFNFKTGNS